MGRTKGAKNKSKDVLPHYASLPTEERIKFLATLIVDRINADQQSGGKLYKGIKGQGNEQRQLLT